MVFVLTTKPADAVKINIQLYDIRRNQSRHVSDICQNQQKNMSIVVLEGGGGLEKMFMKLFF